MTEYHDRASGPPRPVDRALAPWAPGDIKTPPGHNSKLCPTGYIWLGDVAGWEVVPVVRDEAAGAPLQLELRHRCGWAQRQPDEGITGDGAAYVGNIIKRLLEVVETHTCRRRPLSPSVEVTLSDFRANEGADGRQPFRVKSDDEEA